METGTDGLRCGFHCQCKMHQNLLLFLVQSSDDGSLAKCLHCVRTACALRAHCVHIAVKPTPCHLCITLQSNKANRTHIEPLPTRYFDVLVNISFSVVEYHYAVATTVTLVSAIVITYFIIKELSVHSRRTTLIPNRNICRLSRHKISCPYYIPKVVHGHRYLINMACVLGI